MYAALIITCILIILGFCYRKSKFLFFIQGIWLWILIGFNSGGIDYDVNEDIFLHSRKSLSFGEALTYIYELFKDHNLDFYVYTAVTSLVACIIIFGVIYKCSKNICLVASLIYLYPGIDFVIQKRYFLCMSILFLAIQFLNKKGKKNKIIYIILVLIASLCHSSALLYIVPFIFMFIPERYKYKIIIAMGIIGIIGSRYVSRIVSLIPFISSNKVQLYFVELSQNSNIVKFLFWCIWQLLFGLVIRKLYIWANGQAKMNKSLYDALALNIELLCIMPFYAFDPTFTRLYRPVAIEDYMAAVSLLRNGRTQFKTAFISTASIVLLAVGSFSVFYIITGDWKDMYTTVFGNNIFLDWIKG